jgi:DHA3 family macrolide efflux protein-like MFS transporter
VSAHNESRPGWQVRFFTIWTGQTFSLVGSALVRFALIWRLTEETGSAAVLAVASLVALLPPIVLGPVVGTLVDRWRRRWILVIADGAIALLTAMLAWLYWQGIVETWHVYAILFARALGTAFHDPAMTASTSLMVPKEQLARIAGVDGTRQSITEITGPALGAFLVALLPMPILLAIDVVTALLAIGPLLFIDVPQPDIAVARPGAGRAGGWRSVIEETGAGFRYVWNWRGLFVALVSVALIPFFQQPAWSLIPLLVRDHFGGGPREWGWFTVAHQIGGVVGGVLMSTWGGFKRRVMTMLVGLAVVGLINLARGLMSADAYWLFLVAALSSGLPSAMFFASFRAILQGTVPAEMQGRVFSLRNSLFWAMGPLGLAILGPLADVIGVQPLFLMDGAAFLLVALAWALLPGVRNLEGGSPGRAV